MAIRKKIEKSPMVIFGASAGGLENFSAVLSKISPKNNFIYVLIQHLDPKHKSQLASLLKKSTSLPISVIEDGMKPEINHIYVLPASFEARWLNGEFKLSPRRRGSKFEHCTIDVFLESVSEEKNRKLLGVILSGSNTDGTKGLKAIKRAGGITIALDPATTIFPTMPQSAIDHKAVDRVLPLEKIAVEVNKWGKQNLIIKDKEESLINPVLDLLGKSSGVDFSQYKQATLQRRINRRMQLNKISSVGAYIKLLKKNPTELKKLFEEVTIHVTSFFRDADSFESVQKKVLPKIITSSPKQAVRVWVPACSTGQEAYSIGMFILNYIETTRSKAVVQIFATDVSEDSIKKARAGNYSDEEVATIPEKLLKKYFSRTDTGYKVTKELRNSCVFARHDLTSDASFSQMDLICCRNLLIYFNQNNQKKAFHTFNYALKPSGFLFLGHEESLGNMDKLFNVVDRKNSIFKKSELHSASPNAKSPISHNTKTWETKRGTPFLSKTDHEEFIKIAKTFSNKKPKVTKETPAKANARLQKEIHQIHSYFEKLVENQSALYEELQATHEEVLASNEELQTKNEEFETTQEELQATNEELTSINDEMVDRNLDLIRLNEEIAISSIKISEEKDFSRAIVDTVKEPIIVLDEKLIVQSVNLPFLAAFKVTTKETIGSSLFMLGNNQWDIPVLKKFLLDILPHRSSFKDFEIAHDFPRIGRRVISLNARQLSLPHSEKQLILLAMEDVTNKNLIKDKIQKNVTNLVIGKSVSDATVIRLEQEKLLREKFVSTLSHDLKNPLTAAKMAAQLMVRYPEDVEKSTRLSSRIVGSLERVESMIADLLDANQIQAGEGVRLNIETFDVKAVLLETIEELISVHGERFNIIANESIKVDSDPKAFRRIIENLISNAIKYGDVTKNIKITLRLTSDKMFELNVQNFGPVIEVKDLMRIFNQYGRTDTAHNSSHSGWGIGLTLVRGITDGLGGEVTVSSNQVEGTNFRVKLPTHSVITQVSQDLSEI